MGSSKGWWRCCRWLVVAVVLFRLDATLALLALSPLPLLAAGALTYTLTAHKRYRLQRTASSTMNCAAARQPGRGPADQDVRAGAGGACALQYGEPSTGRGDAGGDEGVGALFAGDGFPGGGGAGAGGGVWRERGAARADWTWGTTSNS